MAREGDSAGLVIFFAGSVAYLTFKFRPIEAHKATSINLLTSLTVHNPGWWVALVVILGLAGWWFKFRS